MAEVTTAGKGLVQQSGRLAQIFGDVFLLVEPFFDPDNSWGGQPLEHLAFRALREQYPDLSGDEIIMLIAAVRRVYATS
ncbi:MAG: hypothetical protein NT123_23310 [Proteobacteria bacterium]|nr:hypothetical protein [Pseudomonadota bacterium]